MPRIEELVEGELYKITKHPEFKIVFKKEDRFLLVAKTSNIDTFEKSGLDYNVVLNLCFELYKPPYTPSPDEIQLFKLLPEWVKWIAADYASTTISVFQNKPIKENKFYSAERGACDDLPDLFKHIIKLDFEDGPLNIEQYRG